MLNNSLRTISRITHGSQSLKAPCFPLRMIQTTTSNQHILRLGTCCTVRSINIRRVVVSPPSTATAHSKKSTPPRAPRDRELGELYKDVDFQKLDVDAWLSRIPLPPDTYWETWGPVLKQLEKGGLVRANKLLDRWHDGLATSYRIQRHSFYKAREIVQCTGRFYMPLLGDRTVVAYGYTQKEAIKNLYPVLVSTMYQDGELETVFEGTMASRRLIAIYEQATEYGLFPRFKLSMSNDQPGAHFQITLSVPEWNVQVLTSAPTYVEALSTAVASYEEKVKKRDVKKRISPEVTKARMADLKSATAYHALRYILRKLNVKTYGKKYQKLNTAGPQHIYDIWIKDRLSNADVPMIRKYDAPKIANLTAAVTVLQRYGFHNIDGFSEHFEANKPNRAEPTILHKESETGGPAQSLESSPEQTRLDQAEQETGSNNEHLMAHLYDNFNEGLEEDAVKGMSDAEDGAGGNATR